jgi:2-dehydropantoate 2-reductase
MNILIEGLGGIGGVVAGTMIDAGFRPVLITGNPAITEAVQRDGIRAKTPEKSCHVRADVYTRLDEAAAHGPFDAAYLIMKAQGVVDTARSTVPFLKPEGCLVTFQNGIVEDDVMEAVGAERVVSACVAWGGTMHAPGIYERTSPGHTIIGELDGRVTDRVRALAAALEPAAPVTISQNMCGVLWSKLAINCTINSVGALTGQTLGEMLRDPRIRTLFLRTYSEVIDTAEALGVQLERIAAHPKLLYLPKDAGWITCLGKDVVAQLLGRKYAKTKSSTLQSLERGRPTEVDFLNGYVVTIAAKAGVPTPLNAALTRMIKEIESGARSISLGNIDHLLKETEQG